MDIKFNVCCLNINPKLYVQLQKAIQAKEVDAQISQVTVNYRDSSYSSKTGSHPYPELVKEVDFDFSAYSHPSRSPILM
ncbi:DUF2787 family protein [Psychromonas antarctica]|uniref:DUF2787 family protein n=1 Tax=Psychromonas antarctica TaxID=67573 RepID=UPI001EE8C199|nr:DUF2787 family protein [Psychromonas antarctica]MCG6202304.1 DUF2787 domain-containing protein [Psychromonas antarctica]